MGRIRGGYGAKARTVCWARMWLATIMVAATPELQSMVKGSGLEAVDGCVPASAASGGCLRAPPKRCFCHVLLSPAFPVSVTPMAWWTYLLSFPPIPTKPRLLSSHPSQPTTSLPTSPSHLPSTPVGVPGPQGPQLHRVQAGDFLRRVQEADRQGGQV